MKPLMELVDALLVRRAEQRASSARPATRHLGEADNGQALCQVPGGEYSWRYRQRSVDDNGGDRSEQSKRGGHSRHTVAVGRRTDRPRVGQKWRFAVVESRYASGP
jgi:hypothetical protein